MGGCVCLGSASIISIDGIAVLDERHYLPLPGTHQCCSKRRGRCAAWGRNSLAPDRKSGLHKYSAFPSHASPTKINNQ